MSSSFFLTQLISAALLPPLNLLLIALAGLLVARSHQRLGRALLVGSVALLWICSTPFFAGNALRLLERSVKTVNAQTQSADAIIVLGGGTYFQPPEYGADTVNDATLVRVRYAAKLQRETSKPILVTGGKPQGNDLSEAQQMKSVLENEFKVPVRWKEDASNNTLENARYSFKLLHKAGINRVYLVTHAWHMPRSTMIFEAAGFEVIPAPTAFTTYYQTTLLHFLPGADALGRSWVLMHELIGLPWYRLRV